MMDEVKIDEEGRVIEKVLIKYFQTKPQEVNKQSEEGELENSLTTLATKHKITSLNVLIEIDPPNEYFKFFSRAVEPSDKQSFTCRISGNLLEVVKDPTLFDSPPFFKQS
jgi:D-tyrosyl-tRNA(Tyr) deacylase